MAKFQFNGDWEFPIKLDAFEGYLDNGKDLLIRFEDDFSDNPDPNLEQLNTFNYIIENQPLIRDCIFEKINEEMPKLRAEWGNDEEMLSFYPFPATADTLKGFIFFRGFEIFNPHKEGYAYFGCYGECSWDPEHGIGFSLYKNEVIYWGDSSYGPNSSKSANHTGQNEYWSKQYSDWNDKQPVFYDNKKLKYQRLKPRQQECNDDYIIQIIRKNRIQDLIHKLTEKEYSINQIFGSKSILTYACAYKCYPLIDYLLENQAVITSSAVQEILDDKIYLKKMIDLNSKVVNFDLPNDKRLIDLAVNQDKNIKIENENQFLEAKYSCENWIKYLKSKGAITKQEEYLNNIIRDDEKAKRISEYLKRFE